MKRVLVVAEWINLTGGVTRTLLELLKRFDPKEFDVTLYVMRPAQSDLGAVPDGIRTVSNHFDLPYLGARRVIRTLLHQRKIEPLLRYMFAAVRWRLGGSRADYVRFFTKDHPQLPGEYDIALSYGMLDTYGNQYVAERVSAPRKVMWCHTDASLYSEKELSGLGSVFMQFDAINCVSKDAEISLARRFPDLAARLRVRHNLMDEDRIARLSTEPTPESPPGVVVLTTVARISPEKGIDLLVEAAIRLRNEGWSSSGSTTPSISSCGGSSGRTITSNSPGR